MSDRLAVYFSVLILAALAGLSYWAARQAKLAAAIGPEKPVTHEPDFFVERFVTLKTDKAGLPTYRLAAERMTHYPDDDSSLVARPRSLNLAPQRPPVTVEADSARTTSEGERIDLYGNVRLVRAEQPQAGGRVSESIVVRTTTMTLFPDDDIARSDAPVEIVQGRSRIEGRGMEYNNITRVLDVKSAARSVLAPHETAPATKGQP